MKVINVLNYNLLFESNIKIDLLLLKSFKRMDKELEFCSFLNITRNRSNFNYSDNLSIISNIEEKLKYNYRRIRNVCQI
jgi:hypothetical protein